MNWLSTKPKSDKEGITKLLILAIVLLFCVLPIISIIFWCVFWVPWLFISLVSFCLLLSCICIIHGIFFKEYRRKSWSIAGYIFFSFGCFFISSIAMVCACFIWANFGLRMPSSKVRFPAGYTKVIGIDRKGHIYCADRMYCRIQVFNKDGSFVIGWFVPIKGKYSGVVRFFIDENDQVHLVNRNKTYIYDSLGNLLTVNPTNAGLEGYSVEKKEIVKDNSEILYKSVNKVFSRWQLVKVEGKKEIVLTSEPLSLWLVGGFFPSFPLTIISILLWSLLKRCTKSI